MSEEVRKVMEIKEGDNVAIVLKDDEAMIEKIEVNIMSERTS